MGLLGVVKCRGVGVYLILTAVWQGQLYLLRRREGLDQTWSCRCTSESLLAYRMKILPVKSMHRTLYCSTQLKLQIRSTAPRLCLAMYVKSGLTTLLTCILLWNSHFFAVSVKVLSCKNMLGQELSTEKRKARFPTAATLCLLSKAFQFGSGARLASYSVDAEVKRLGGENDYRGF
jgi:hypothetical protein